VSDAIDVETATPHHGPPAERPKIQIVPLKGLPVVAVAVIFVIVYQQVENHFLQPVIYGRTVQLSALAVLVSVLVGAELAGILGALAAIPVAGTLQVLIRDQLAYRRGAQQEPAPVGAVEPAG